VPRANRPTFLRTLRADAVVRPARALRTALAAGVASAALAGRLVAQDSFIPEVVAPSAAVVESAAAPHLASEERARFRVLHGVFDDLDLADPALRAVADLERARFADVLAAGDAAPLATRLAALAAIGRDRAVLEATAEVLDLPALAARAAALARLGRTDEALAIARDPAVREATASGGTVDDVLAAVDLGALRIRLDAEAAGEYPSLLAALGRARQTIDRLDHRVRLREAALLADRGKTREAVEALGEALSLHPRSAEAWLLAGRIALDRFDFLGAANAVRALRRIDPAHAFAAVLETRAALLEDDPARASAILAPVVAREDAPIAARHGAVAVLAARYDFDAMRAALDVLAAEAPGSADAELAAGRQLALDRQYAEAREALEAAAAREPTWARPRAELGLLAMQDGREETAVADLRLATRLDPHDERTLFTLALAEQLAGWPRIETAHFVVRHPPAADGDADGALVAALLAPVLDGMHEEVCARLGHEPAVKTIIDVMPDHRSFGVRIMGLPRIHTIAVCTGPTIAIEIPKEGASSRHLGLFDPLSVLRHEYTHTVTLSMTRNRIPHWLTEAVAVALEDTPRTYETCRLLATAWRRGELFDLDGINWAFVRPEKPTDRAQAYAQGRWMVEFMERRFGWESVNRLVASYAEGIREDEAMRRAFGVSREAFREAFLAWAGGEVRAWGLDPQPSLLEITRALADGDEAAEEGLRDLERRRLEAVVAEWTAATGRPSERPWTFTRAQWPVPAQPAVDLDDATLAALLERHPAHPDLLEIAVRRAQRDGSAGLGALLDRYAAARPVDPMPHRLWAKTALAGADASPGGASALAHLEALDLVADKDNVYALAIARRARAAGDLPRATRAIERAVRMNPFDAGVRELAAATAVEAGDLAAAERHVEALVAIESDRPVHRARLDRIRALRGADTGSTDGR
jgi:tetratricopeptide (TPR) repeat protein